MKKTFKRHFADWHAFTQYVTTTPRAENARNESNEVERGPCPWSGTNTWDDAVKLMREGWREGRSTFLRGLEVAPSLLGDGRAPALAWNVAGRRVSVPRAVMNNPRSMLGRGEDVTSGRKIVRLVVQISASASVATTTIENRGIALCSVIDALEDAGFSFEVTVAHDAIDVVHSSERVVIKAAGDPLDLDRMAFALANPAMLRRAIFRVEETVPELWPHFSGYGMPVETPESDIDPGVIYFPGMNAARASLYADLPDACRAVMREVCDGIGNTIIGHTYDAA